MDLDTYLRAKHAPSLTDLARRTGVSVGHLHDIKTGRRMPSMALASRIEAETGGQVTLQDLAQGVAA